MCLCVNAQKGSELFTGKHSYMHAIADTLCDAAPPATGAVCLAFLHTKLLACSGLP